MREVAEACERLLKHARGIRLGDKVMTAALNPFEDLESRNDSSRYQTHTLKVKTIEHSMFHIHSLECIFARERLGACQPALASNVRACMRACGCECMCAHARALEGNMDPTQ